MLMVLFQIGRDRYAINCADLIEIVPLVPLKSVPQAPDFIAGILAYRGTAVPVVDLCQLTEKRPSNSFFSSRILLLDYGRLTTETTGVAKSTRILGLIAEHVTEIREAPGAQLTSPVHVAGAPYLGGVFFLAGEMNQCLEPAELLPAGLREILFTESVGSSAQA